MPKERSAVLERLADTLSKRIREEQRAIDDIHRFRGVRTRNVFIKSGVTDHYIMHAGGRRETQFNVGFEGDGKQSRFRYGVAFSLEASRTLVDPLQEFRNRINAFNELVRENPGKFAGYKLSISLPSGEWKRDLEPQPVQDEFVVPGAFIFIGKSIPREFGVYDQSDVGNILDVLDDLYPVYKDIELRSRLPVKEFRVSRVCWNDNGWVRPSGPNGKSRNAGSFERQFGYGHEEWLFQYDSLYDGMQYAYLQSVQQSIDAYEGRAFDIGIFSLCEIDPRDKKIVWVARINNVYVLTKKERQDARERASEGCQFKARIQELQALGLSQSDIRGSFEKYGVFNIRFSPHDVVFISEGQDAADFPEIPSYHYTLMRCEPNGFGVGSSAVKFLTLSGKTSLERGGARRGIVRLEERECSDLHVVIQNDLAEMLRAAFPGHAVDLETATGFGTHIDCYREGGNEKVFYEVKTYASAKKCIREALGQLLEYALYPDKPVNFRLEVVGYAKPSSDDVAYLRLISKRTGIQIRYLVYHLEARTFAVAS